MRTLHPVPLAIGLALMAGSPAALAQTALGNGQGLYRDLQRRNPLATQGRDFAAEARNRNSIAFGRAPGGLSFRGRTGFNDPADFLGRLGSDSLNSFTANSTYSAMVAQGIRGQQAIEQQRALAVGAPRPAGFRGNLETWRNPTFSGADLNPAARESRGALRVDPLGDWRNQSRRPGNVLSSRLPPSNIGGGDPVRGSALTSGSAFAANYTGQAGQDTGAGTSIADRLGISTRLPGRVSGLDTDTPYGSGRLEGLGGGTLAGADRWRREQEQEIADAQQSRSQLGSTRPGNFSESLRAARGDRRAPTQTPGTETAYDQLRNRLDKMGPIGAPKPTEPGAQTQAEAELTQKSRAWEQIEKLRTTLAPEEQGRVSLLGPRGSRSPLANARIEKRQDLRATPGRPQPTTPGQTPKPDEEKPLDPDTLRLIRDAAAEVADLAPIGVSTTRDFYTEHMKVGQVFLEQGQYFDAEERFTRALASKPGDVTAQIGRVHAQLGAGLVQSAGQNLRILMANHPEVAGLRYAPKLLPPRDRLQTVLELLRENLGAQGTLRRESALLLAYVGFQTRDAEVARAGVNSIAAIAEQDPEAQSGGDARLAELLRGIWLDPSLYQAKDADGKDAPPAPEK